MPGDSLRLIFQKQAELQDKIEKEHTDLPHIRKASEWSEAVKTERTKHHLFCLIAEAIEVTEWIPWKDWKTKQDPINRGELAYELSDILHFFVNICMIHGIGPEEIVGLYLDKQKQNQQRQEDKY